MCSDSGSVGEAYLDGGEGECDGGEPGLVYTSSRLRTIVVLTPAACRSDIDDQSPCDQFRQGVGERSKALILALRSARSVSSLTLRWQRARCFATSLLLMLCHKLSLGTPVPVLLTRPTLLTAFITSWKPMASMPSN